jgi:nucleotidyltransferase substrate binding protein (TIGR01987 family)
VTPLDFSPLARAIARLDEGLTRYLADTSDAQIRDGLIQRFEFTYDLSTKMLRRTLEAAADIQEQIDQMSFPALIRTADEQNLLRGSWPEWRVYREMRNITSRTYDEEKALQWCRAFPAFWEKRRSFCAACRPPMGEPHARP